MSSSEISSKQSDEESKPLWKCVTKYDIDKADDLLSGFCFKEF